MNLLDLIILVLALVYAYTGFRNIIELPGEVREPRRHIPAALVTTIGVTIVLYLGLQVAFLGAVTVFGGTPTVANTASVSVFGEAGNDTIALNEANGALPNVVISPSRASGTVFAPRMSLMTASS